MPLSPEWANLPRRKCDDCGKTYKPVKPSRPGERGFCCANCRKSYHKHGGAYRKLKAEMQKMVSKELAALEKRVRGIVREEMMGTYTVSLPPAHAKSTSAPPSSPSAR